MIFVYLNFEIASFIYIYMVQHYNLINLYTYLIKNTLCRDYTYTIPLLNYFYTFAYLNEE